VSYLLYLRVQGHAVTRIAWSSAQAGGVGPVRRTPSRRLKIKAGASDTPSCSGESSERGVHPTCEDRISYSSRGEVKTVA
jgi:hypothetical protein